MEISANVEWKYLTKLAFGYFKNNLTYLIWKNFNFALNSKLSICSFQQ